MKELSIKIRLTAPMIDLMKWCMKIDDLEGYKIDDLLDSLITATENIIAGNQSFDADRDVIMKRVLSDELFLIINDDNDFRLAWDNIQESILHLSDILLKYNMLDKYAQVNGVCLLTESAYITIRN